MNKSKKDLSIVILNYNTKELVVNCVNSIVKNTKGVDYEIIVVDNGSDEKLGEIKGAKVIENGLNLGFSAGNNKARGYCSGEFVLFLNSDTLVHSETLKKALDYIKLDETIGALSVKTVLPDGTVDRDAMRSFPTPWVAFTHFSGLDRLFPKSRLFARYWYGYRSPDQVYDVEVIQGAFCLVRRSLLEKIDWYDEAYFLDGEDIDLSWRIWKAGKRIVYYPDTYITHIKKATKRKVKASMGQGVVAMEIFYKKRMWKSYPLFVNLLVIFGIKLLKMVRAIYR